MKDALVIPTKYVCPGQIEYIDRYSFFFSIISNQTDDIIEEQLTANKGIERE